MTTAFGPEAFQRATGVSRETMTRLHRYADLLASWQKRINLVAAATIGDLWRRHMLDSAQLVSRIEGRPKVGVDLGSGAGFPGLVIALCAPPEWSLTMHLLESDQRKAVFLREATRLTGAPAVIHAERIETIAFPADLVVARALAPLPELLPYASQFWSDGTCGLFLKGRRVADELAHISDCWSLTYDVVDSLSDSSGRIVRVRNLARV